MSTKGGPVFTLSLPRGAARLPAPRQLRYCLRWQQQLPKRLQQCCLHLLLWPLFSLLNSEPKSQIN